MPGNNRPARIAPLICAKICRCRVSCRSRTRLSANNTLPSLQFRHVPAQAGPGHGSKCRCKERATASWAQPGMLEPSGWQKTLIPSRLWSHLPLRQRSGCCCAEGWCRIFRRCRRLCERPRDRLPTMWYLRISSIWPLTCYQRKRISPCSTVRRRTPK